MRKIKTIIVDDEIHGRENLRSILTNYCPEIDIIGEAASVSEARNNIPEWKPELIFLDILMPVQNGFDLLDHFPERKFVVIFVSASMEFGIQAVKAGVMDYILKPINIKEIQLAVRKVADHFSKDTTEIFSPKSPVTKIALSYAGGFVIEEIENITRLQADDNYTKVFTANDKQYLISRPLKDFERLLPPELFIRTHKSHIINVHYLKDFCNEDGGLITLKNGFKVPVSKRKGPAFLGAIRKFSLMLRG